MLKEYRFTNYTSTNVLSKYCKTVYIIATNLFDRSKEQAILSTVFFVQKLHILILTIYHFV